MSFMKTRTIFQSCNSASPAFSILTSEGRETFTGEGHSPGSLGNQRVFGLERLIGSLH